MSVRPATLSGPRTPARGPAGATAIVAALAGAGTRVLFGVPGGGPNLDVVGAAGAAGLRFVLTHTETAAAIMAATSADLTGTPGAVLVTRGPGLASAVNGIAHAALDRLPLVVIADTVRAAEAGRVSHQRLDQEALGGPVAKAVLTISGDRAGQTAARAVRRALAGPPGPVIALMDDGAPAAGPAKDPDGEHPDAEGLDGEGPDAEGPDAEGLAEERKAERKPVTSGRWPPPWARPGGRSCCSARRLSRTPTPSGLPWPAAGSPRCTPTGRAASCPMPRPKQAGWSPAARWSGRCWLRPTSSSGWVWTRPR